MIACFLSVAVHPLADFAIYFSLLDVGGDVNVDVVGGRYCRTASFSEPPSSVCKSRGL